jgi:hypothetical protein
MIRLPGRGNIDVYQPKHLAVILCFTASGLTALRPSPLVHIFGHPSVAYDDLVQEFELIRTLGGGSPH